jgi:protein O-GlcNAc transferase
MQSSRAQLDAVANFLAQGDVERADRLCREVLDRESDNVAALALQGSIDLAADRPASAAAWLTRALLFAPDHPILLVNLGEAYRRAGRTSDALTHLRRAVAVRMDMPAAHYNLGMACLNASLWPEAIAAFETALSLDPDIDVAGHYKDALWRNGDREGAIAHQRRLVARQPEQAPVHFELGALLLANHLPDEAVDCFERAHALGPTHRETLVQLTSALVANGQVDDAVKTLERLIDLGGDTSAFASQRLFLLQYHPDYDSATIVREANLWRERYVDSSVADERPRPRAKIRDKRLRVGYVSSHFLTHVSCFFTLPLFRAHRREEVEVFCYSNARTPDAGTELHKRCADSWRDVGELREDEVAALVQRDEVDVLVDLTMHAAGGRPGIFARRPAPVQMCWLAYPGTTGLREIDYRISDPHLDPPSADAREYTETTLRLPDTFWCYDPAAPDIDPVSPSPLSKNGYVTFACLNSVMKTNRAVLELWSRVLARVPRSKLLVQSPPGRPRERILDTLARSGVVAERIEFVNALPRAAYFAQYHRCDIGLDTFPASGHTTSMDAFFMGVPVVTLAGPTVAARGGVTIAMNVDLPELVARSADDYVERAVRLAEDPARLRDLRAALRARMVASPLMDAPRFARNLEALYRRAWHAYCEGDAIS